MDASEFKTLDIDHLNFVGSTKGQLKKRILIGANIYYKTSAQRKNEYIFVKKTSNGLNGHKVKINYQVNGVFSLKGDIYTESLKDKIKFKYGFDTHKNIWALGQSASKISSINDDYVTLENVTVVGYIRRPDNSIAISVFLSGEIFNEANQNTYYSAFLDANAEYVLPADDGGNQGGYAIPPPEAIEFESEEEFAAYTDWLKKLNAAELQLVLQFPAESVIVFRHTMIAERLANIYPGIRGGRADALRHSLWNALNASYLGKSMAKLFADAHEMTPLDPTKISSRLYLLEREMDLHNNDMGRQLAGKFLSADAATYFRVLKEYYEDGLLKYVCDPDGIFNNGNESLRYSNEGCF